MVSIPELKDPLEKEMTTHFSILALETSWKEEPGFSPGDHKRVRHALETKTTSTNIK